MRVVPGFLVGIVCAYGALTYRLFIEYFLQMCFEGKWLQNRLIADGNELRLHSAVDIQGHQRGGFCIVPGASTGMY